MIGLIIWLVICFTWLLYETDFLRVRLLIGVQCQAGECCDWRLPDSAVTGDMKQELFDKAWSKTNSAWGYFKDYHNPLCGWGFAYQYKDFEPEYKIELIAPGSKYTFRTQSTAILRDAFRVYRNPYLKVKIKDAQAY